MKAKMPEEKKKPNKERFVIAEVTTQTAPVIRDMEKKEDEEGAYFNEMTMLCKIMNTLEEVKKNLM